MTQDKWQGDSWEKPEIVNLEKIARLNSLLPIRNALFKYKSRKIDHPNTNQIKVGIAKLISGKVVFISDKVDFIGEGNGNPLPVFFAWRIPGMRDPGGLLSVVLSRT